MVIARSQRNPRRAYDTDWREIPPRDLGNMREHEVRFVAAICQEVYCGHSGLANVDGLPDDAPVLGVALHARCSAYGSRNVNTVPDWREGQWAREYGKGP